MKTILLIDDDKDDADIFREALYATSPTVSFFWSNGTGVIDMLHQKSIPLPDIIFLDINMPGMDGWACLRLLKQHSEFSKIPVLMYSTTSRASERQKAMEMGARDLIMKPDNYLGIKAILELNFLNKFVKIF